MHLLRHPARRPGEWKCVANAHTQEDRERSPKDFQMYLPLLNCSVEGKGSRVVVHVRNLQGFEDDEAKAKYLYRLEMSIAELSQIVSKAMKVAPSAELLRAVVDGAAAALPRRSTRRKA